MIILVIVAICISEKRRNDDESRIDHINTLVLTEGVRDSLAEPPPIPMYLELDPCPAYGMIDGKRTFRLS